MLLSPYRGVLVLWFSPAAGLLSSELGVDALGIISLS